MKINSNGNLRVAAWLRGALALAAGVGVVGCGGGSGGTSRPNAGAGEIVFISDREIPNVSGDSKLFRANLDGSNLTYIATEAGTRPFSSPAWSPDRQEVFYSNFLTGSRGGISLSQRAVKRDGTGDRAIFPSTEGSLRNPNGAEVSPDGRRLIYANYGAPFDNGQLDFEVFIANIDGTNSQSIAKGSQPSWSPDGRRITYIASVEESSLGGIYTSTPSVFVMNVDGTNPTRLTTNLGSGENPHFSPDGTRIVYEFTPFEIGPTGIQTETEIYVMNTDGSNQTKLTNFEGTYIDFKPKWTPDGRIVFHSRTGLLVMNANGSNQKPLFDTPISVQDFDIR